MLKIFESDLRGRSVIITGSFQDVIGKKINRFKRVQQLVFMFSTICLIPTFAVLLVCALDTGTRIKYQYYLADYFEQLGLFGRTLKMGYLAFAATYVCDKISLWKSESKGSHEFMADLQQLHEEDTRMMNDDERKQLLKTLKVKIILAKIIPKMTIWTNHFFDFISLPMFFYNEKPSMVIGFYALTHFVITRCCVEVAMPHFFYLYLSYVITTDVLNAKIASMKQRTQDIRFGFDDSTLKKLLRDINVLKETFEKYRKTMKPLLRNLITTFRIGLCTVFFLSTIDMALWMRALSLVNLVGFSALLMLSGLYISGLKSTTTSLYEDLSQLSGWIAFNIHSKSLSAKTRLHLKLVIKELGCEPKDRNFVVGLSDGNGPAITKMEIIELTLETIANTLIVMDMVN